VWRQVSSWQNSFDWRKPDGLFVITPENVATFLPPLSVGRLPGVGRVTEEKLRRSGIRTVGELQNRDDDTETNLGRYGLRLYELSRGVDESSVVSHRPTQSISAENTFEQDIPLSQTEPVIRRLAQSVWSSSRKESRVARTVVLKLRTSEFQILTRSHTPPSPPSSCEELIDIALSLRERVDLSPQRSIGWLSRFRQLGGRGYSTESPVFT
jgi:DNA polymerase-4